MYIGNNWKHVAYQTESGEGKNITIRTKYEVIERTIDNYRQFLFPSDLVADTWWIIKGMTNTRPYRITMITWNAGSFTARLRRTWMRNVCLPESLTPLNELVLEVAILAYNILGMTGQESIGQRGTKSKNKVHRLRLRTVIWSIVMLESHVIRHVLIIELGKSNTWRHAFAEI